MTDTPSSRNIKKSDNTNPSDKPLSESDYKKIFDDQNKKYSFRNKRLKEYREKVLKLYQKSDIMTRFNNAISKGDIKTRKITEKKLEERAKPYGESGLNFNLEYNSRLERFVLVARTRNKKLQAFKDFTLPDAKTVTDKKKLAKIDRENILKQTDELRDKIAKKGFDFIKNYIPEDSEPKRQTDKRINVKTTYSTYYRYGILIYQYKKGKRYQLIYQANGAMSPRATYLSYQEVIAQIKEDVLNATGATLEDWIYLSKIKKNIFIEGGLTFKRFKGKLYEKSRKFEEELDYQVKINWEDV